MIDFKVGLKTALDWTHTRVSPAQRKAATGVVGGVKRLWWGFQDRIMSAIGLVGYHADLPKPEALKELLSSEGAAVDDAALEAASCHDQQFGFLSDKQFLIMHGDAFLSGTGWEGSSHQETIPYLARYLRAHGYPSDFVDALTRCATEDMTPPMVAKALAIPAIEESSKRAAAASGLRDRMNYYADGLADRVGALPVGGRMLISGGWGSIDGGHAMLYEVRREEDSYSFFVYNSGEGIRYHEHEEDGEKSKSVTNLRIRNVSREKMIDHQFFRALVDPMICINNKGDNYNWDAAKLYRVFALLKGEVDSADDLMTPQKSGTCGWKSVLAALRHDMVDRYGKEKAIPMYKRMRVAYRLQSLVDFYQTSGKRLCDPDYDEQRLGFKDALQRTIRYARRQYLRKHIDLEELTPVFATCRHLLKEVAAADRAAAVGLNRPSVNPADTAVRFAPQDAYIEPSRPEASDAVDRSALPEPAPVFKLWDEAFPDQFEAFTEKMYDLQRSGDSKRVMRQIDAVIMRFPIWGERAVMMWGYVQDRDRITEALERLATVYHAALTGLDISQCNSRRPHVTVIKIFALICELQPIKGYKAENTVSDAINILINFSKTTVSDPDSAQHLADLEKLLISSITDSSLSLFHHAYRSKCLHLVHDFPGCKPKKNDYLATLLKDPEFITKMDALYPETRGGSSRQRFAALYANPDRGLLPKGFGQRLRMAALLSFMNFAPSFPTPKHCSPQQPEGYRISTKVDRHDIESGRDKLLHIKLDINNSDIKYLISNQSASEGCFHTDLLIPKIGERSEVLIERGPSLQHGYYHSEYDHSYSGHPELKYGSKGADQLIWMMRCQPRARPSLAVGYYSEPGRLPLLAEEVERQTLYHLLFQGHQSLLPALELNPSLADEFEYFLTKGYETFYSEGWHNNPEACLFFLHVTDLLRPFVRRVCGDERAARFGLDTGTEYRRLLDECTGQDEESKSVRSAIALRLLASHIDRGITTDDAGELAAALALVQITPPPNLRTNKILYNQLDTACELLTPALRQHPDKGAVARQILGAVWQGEGPETFDSARDDLYTVEHEGITWTVDLMRVTVFRDDERLGGLPDWVTEIFDVERLTDGKALTVITVESPTCYKAYTADGDTYRFFQDEFRMLRIHRLFDGTWHERVQPIVASRAFPDNYLSQERTWWVNIDDPTQGILTSKTKPMELIQFGPGGPSWSCIPKKVHKLVDGKPGPSLLLLTGKLPQGLSALNGFDLPGRILVWKDHSVELTRYNMTFNIEGGRLVMADDPSWHVAKNQRAPVPGLNHSKQFLIIENDKGERQVLVPRVFPEFRKGALARRHPLRFDEKAKIYRFSIASTRQRGALTTDPIAAPVFRLEADDPEAHLMLAYVYILTKDYDHAIWHLSRLRAGATEGFNTDQLRIVKEILATSSFDITGKARAVALHAIALSHEVGTPVDANLPQLLQKYRRRRQHIGTAALPPDREQLLYRIAGIDKEEQTKKTVRQVAQFPPFREIEYLITIPQLFNLAIKLRKSRMNNRDRKPLDGATSFLPPSIDDHCYHLFKIALTGTNDARARLAMQLELDYEDKSTSPFYPILRTLVHIPKEDLSHISLDFENTHRDASRWLKKLVDAVNALPPPPDPSTGLTIKPSRRGKVAEVALDIITPPHPEPVLAVTHRVAKVAEPERHGYNEDKIISFHPLHEKLGDCNLLLEAEPQKVIEEAPQDLLDYFDNTGLGRVSQGEMKRQHEAIQAYYTHRAENPPIAYTEKFGWSTTVNKNKKAYYLNDIHRTQYYAREFEDKMHALINKRSTLAADVLAKMEKLAAGQRRHCTTDEMLMMWQHDDSAFYKKYNANLTDVDCRKLNTLICNFLTVSRRTQHMQRCLDQLDTAIELDGDERKAAMQKLGEFESEVDLIQPDNRLVALFAHYSGYMIWSNQYEKIQALTQTDDQGELINLIAELLMGSGKSALILPLLARATADGVKIPLLIIPETLIEENREYLRCINGSYFGQQIETIKVPLSKPLSIDEIDALQTKLNRIRDQRSYGILTDRSAHNLLIQYKNSRQRWLSMTPLEAEMNPHLGEAYRRLKAIRIQLRDHGHAIIDEADAVLRTRQETHLSYGDEVALEENLRTLLVDFIQDAVKDKELGQLLRITGETEADFDVAAYNKVKPKLAKLFLDKLEWKPKDRRRVLRYLLSNPAVPTPAAAAGTEINDDLADELSLIRKMIETYLPTTLPKNAYQRFGLGRKESIAYCVPFLRGNPKTGAEFATREEASIFTLLYYAREGVAQRQFLAMVKHLRLQGRYERRASGNTIALSETEAFKTFAKLKLKEGQTLYSMNKKKLIALCSYYNGSMERKLEYAQQFALPNIKAHTKKHSSNGQLLVDLLFHNVRGFTGTLHAAQQMSRKLSTLPDKVANGKTIAILFESKAQVKKVETSIADRAKLLDTLTDAMIGYDLYTDVPGLLRKFSSVETARNLVTKLPDNKKGVVTVWDEDEPPKLRGRLVVLQPKKKPKLVSKSKLTGDDVIGVLKEADTVGVDFKWGRRGLCGISTVPGMRDFKQGVWRLRDLDKLLNPQKADLLRPEALSEIDTVGKGLRLVTRNQARRVGADNLHATKQKIHAHVEQFLDTTLLDADEQREREIYQLVQAALEPEIPLDPSLIYGTVETMQQVRKVLDKVIDRALKPLSEALDAPTLQTLRDDLDAIADKEVVYLDEKVMDEPQNDLGQIQEVQKQIEKEVETEVETKVETETETTGAKNYLILRDRDIDNCTNLKKFAADAIYTTAFEESRPAKDTETCGALLRRATDAGHLGRMPGLDKIFDPALKLLPDHYLYLPTESLEEGIEEEDGIVEECGFLSGNEHIAVPFSPTAKDIKRFIIRQNIKTGAIELYAATPNHEVSLHLLFKGQGKGVKAAEYRVGLYDLHSGLLAQSTYDKFPDLTDNKQLKTLRVQAKFYNGNHSDYSKEEQKILESWIKQHDLTTMKTLFTRYIIRDRPKEVKAAYNKSILHKIFYKLTKEQAESKHRKNDLCST